MHINNILEGFKFGVGIILAFTLLFSIYAAGWHTAGEILGGTFLGNYIFNGTVEFQDKIVADNITLSPAKNDIIYFDPSMTAQEIQDRINNVSKFIPYGRTVTFQFKDGTYNLDQTLYFSGFYGGGSLTIFGNTTETNADILHSTQQVFLDFSSQNIHGIEISKNEVSVALRNIKVKINTNTDWNNAVRSLVNSNYINIRYNYLMGTSTSYGIGIHHSYSGAIGFVGDTYVDNLNRGIQAVATTVYSRINDDIGTIPVYGLYASGGGEIAKYSTQPAGSTSNEYLSAGGEIR